MGGWLEAGIREKYGNTVDFSVTHNGVPVTKNADGTVYEHIEGNIDHFIATVGNKKFVIHQLYGDNRGLIASLFIKDIKKQCHPTL